MAIKMMANTAQATKMLKILKEHQGTNVAVFVARTCDGTHIGSTRHQLIADVMKQALSRLT